MENNIFGNKIERKEECFANTENEQTNNKCGQRNTGSSLNLYIIIPGIRLISSFSLFPVILVLLMAGGCEDILEPEPIDRITNEQVLTDASSARSVVSGIYRGFANLGAPKIVAGDMTADLLDHNGTFTQYGEIGTHDMSASNGAASTLWSVIYDISYTVNFLLEGIDDVEGLIDVQRERLLGEARFMRGYAYLVGAYTYGGMPIVTSTNISENRNIARSSREEVLNLVEEDFRFALGKVPEVPQNKGFISNGAVKAGLARLYLYQENWEEAGKFAGEVIDSVGTEAYSLEDNFENVIQDFSDESILEIVYSANDNPGTSTNFSINNLFVGRREIIPSDKIVFALRNEGGKRSQMIEFNSEDAGGRDNGWTITRYGPFDNIPVFRLAEMYLIRAEARAHQGEISGVNSGSEDLNTIRRRAGVAALDINSQTQLLDAIEEERMLELCFEGHRWYDLKRTGRAASVMREVTNNWSETDELWPIPQREIQNNPGLDGAQNPGY